MKLNGEYGSYDYMTYKKEEEEMLKDSMKQSIANKNERLAKEKGMKRLYTPTEEDILREGLKDGEVKEEN